jgi:hypothetical protein
MSVWTLTKIYGSKNALAYHTRVSLPEKKFCKIVIWTTLAIKVSARLLPGMQHLQNKTNNSLWWLYMSALLGGIP